MQAIIEEMRNICALYCDTEIPTRKILELSNEYFCNIRTLYEKLDNEQQSLCVRFLEDVLESDDLVIKIYHTSFLLALTWQEKYLRQLITMAFDSQLSPKEKSFLYWQLVRKAFVNPALLSGDVNVGLRRLYKQIYEDFKKRLLEGHRWIPADARNNNFVVVMTNQFLGPRHSPTQAVVARCHSLNNAVGKEVCIINTADLSRTLVMPFFGAVKGHLLDGYIGASTIQFPGKGTLPFYQCQNLMPDESEMAKIIQLIENTKPELIFSIGGPNITADLCSNIVPVVTLGNSADFPVTEGTFSILTRKLRQEDEFLLDACDISKDQIIESDYTYQFDEPVTCCTRQELGIPEHSFALVVVGYRLDAEITREYAQQLDELLKKNPDIFIVFVGEFTNHSEMSAKYSTFKGQTNYLGKRNDLAAIYDCCDAYLNPRRLGGGASAVEALYRGLPVLTFAFGDVSYAVEEKDYIESLSDIEQFAAKWLSDAEFREKAKTAAKERAKKFTDMDKSTREILSAIENSQFFR